MTNYEFLQSLKIEDTADIFVLFCLTAEFNGLDIRMDLSKYKERLVVRREYPKRYEDYSHWLKPNTLAWLKRTYDGKTVYESVQGWTIEEWASFIGYLCISHRLRDAVIVGYDDCNTHKRGCPPPQRYVDWLKGEYK